MKDLPLLATMGVGSYATPGGFSTFVRACRQGVAGPADVEEAFEDATRVAVADQIEAGLDVICDGELRRMRFVFEMYDRLSGLERTPPHGGSPERSFARWRRERGSCVQASDVEQGSLPSKSGDRP